MSRYMLINGDWVGSSAYVFRKKSNREIIGIVEMIDGLRLYDVENKLNDIIVQYGVDNIEVNWERKEVVTKRIITIDEYRQMCKWA